MMIRRPDNVDPIKCPNCRAENMLWPPYFQHLQKCICWKCDQPFTVSSRASYSVCIAPRSVWWAQKAE